MEISNLFDLNLTATNFSIVFFSAIGSSLLYMALCEFGFYKLIEKLYYESKQVKTVYRVQIYLFLINLPMILLILCGVIYNRSLLPFEVSLKLDQINVFIVSGYICYIEESRHSPLRGFVFLKDCLFLLLTLALFSQVYTNGIVNYTNFVILLPIILFSYILQSFTDDLENLILLALGVRQKNVYNAKFLLTSNNHSSNFLEIKDRILEKKDQIQQELLDFQKITHQINKNKKQAQIIINFSKLFIPLKKGYEIYQTEQNEKAMSQYNQQWLQQQKYQQIEDAIKENDEDQKGNSINNSNSQLIIKRTFTNDSYFDDDHDKKQQKESYYKKFLKIVFCPLYASSDVGGKSRYFLDYLIVFLLAGAMFVQSNCISYFSLQFSTNQNLISLLFAGLLFMPQAKYFVDVSGIAKDCDFLNIFIQGLILKNLVFSLGLLIQDILSQQVLFESGYSIMACLQIRCATFVILAGFLISRRFATRYSNLKVFVGFFVVSQISRIVVEI